MHIDTTESSAEKSNANYQLSSEGASFLRGDVRFATVSPVRPVDPTAQELQSLVERAMLELESADGGTYLDLRPATISEAVALEGMTKDELRQVENKVANGTPLTVVLLDRLRSTKPYSANVGITTCPTKTFCRPKSCHICTTIQIASKGGLKEDTTCNVQFNYNCTFRAEQDLQYPCNVQLREGSQHTADGETDNWEISKKIDGRFFLDAHRQLKRSRRNSWARNGVSSTWNFTRWLKRQFPLATADRALAIVSPRLDLGTDDKIAIVKEWPLVDLDGPHDNYLEQAAISAIPLVVVGSRSPTYPTFVSLVFRLWSLKAGRNFWLSVKELGRKLGVTHAQAGNLRKRAVHTDKIITETAPYEIGRRATNGPKAALFRFNADNFLALHHAGRIIVRNRKGDRRKRLYRPEQE